MYVDHLTFGSEGDSLMEGSSKDRGHFHKEAFLRHALEFHQLMVDFSGLQPELIESVKL